MRRPLVISFALHALILVLALIVLPKPEAFKVDPQDAIPVDIVSIQDLSKRKAMVKSEEPKKVEKPKPKPEEVVKEEPPAPKVEPEVKKAAVEPKADPQPKPVEKAPEPEPLPQPKKVEDKPLEQSDLAALLKQTETDPPPEKKPDPPKPVEKKPEPKPEPKPEVKAEKKPEKTKPKLNTDEISAFLNKTDDKRTAPRKPAKDTGTPEEAQADVTGTDEALAATLIDALRQKLAGCWSIPAGAREADLVVKVRFELSRDGMVRGQPQVLNADASPLFAVTAQSAVSAVLDCQAYDFLPRDKYDLWKDITINFNPNQMFRS
jgi:outer membrane biosynthesis protein TonB